jgi:hypothetical protein
MLSKALVFSPQVPFMEELVAEFRFILRCRGSTKPIRKYNSPEKEESPPAEEENKPQKFVQMNMFGSAPYGFNTNLKEPLA